MRLAPLAAVLLAALTVAAGAPNLCNSLPNLEAFGTGSGGQFGTPVLAGNGLPDIASTGFRFQVSGAFPSAPGMLVLSRHEAATWSPTYQTTIYTSPWVVLVPFHCDGTGAATIAAGPTTHPIAELCGLDVVAQAVVFDFTGPGGATWTQGLRLRFGALAPPVR